MGSSPPTLFEVLRDPAQSGPDCAGSSVLSASLESVACESRRALSWIRPPGVTLCSPTSKRGAVEPKLAAFTPYACAANCRTGGFSWLAGLPFTGLG
eukprot:scaffold35757_cov52-Phaeocystis_antarctica.AAC.4